MSPLAELLYLSDMMYRYAEGSPRKRYYRGNIFVDEIELLTEKLMAKILSANFVELRTISGTIANAVTFVSLARPGDKAVALAMQAGAHISHTVHGVLGGLGIKHVEMPFDVEAWNIDVDASKKVIEDVKPKFVILGASTYLFPHPTKEIADIAHSVNSVVVHDVAHVLGLITGKKWSNPILEGADIATASTHKTFPGPQGGIIYTNNEDLHKAISKNVLMFVSNHHLHRLPALAVTAIEMMYFGEAYAEQVVRNAKTFAESLASEGFSVVAENLGYTSSHMLLVDVSKYCSAVKAAELLEKANIIANANPLPWDPPNPLSFRGLRFGVQEMTRFGMEEQDFVEVAKFLKEIIIDRKEPVEVRRKVIEFRKNYTTVRYGFRISEELLGSLLISLRQ